MEGRAAALTLKPSQGQAALVSDLTFWETTHVLMSHTSVVGALLNEEDMSLQALPHKGLEPHLLAQI